MQELNGYMAGKVMAFRQDGDDPEVDAVLVVEVTDTAGDEIEFTFNMPGRKLRVYLRLPIAAVRAALPDEATPND